MAAGITHEDVAGTLERLKEEDPGLARLLKNAAGYAVFPSVGKAGAVVGGAFGRGEVFERGKRIGYATVSQLTIGVHLGGETFAEVVVFENQHALERLKQGKFAFAANASAALVRAGAAASAGFAKGARALVYSEGGLALEAAIGGQKFKFKPASQTQETDEPEGQPAREDSDDPGESTQDQGFAGRAWEGIREATSQATGLIRRHPIASTVVGAGILTGAAVLSIRALQSTGDADPGDASANESEEPDDSSSGQEPPGE